MRQRKAGTRSQGQFPHKDVYRPPLSYRQKTCPVCKKAELREVVRNGTKQLRCSTQGCPNS